MQGSAPEPQAVHPPAGYPRSPTSRTVRRQQSLTRQASWLFALALFGYPLIGGVISLLQIESRALSIPFRMVVALFSVWVVVSAPRLKMDFLRKSVLMFWFFYSLRLIHDWLFTDLGGADYALQFFVASCVLPAIALMKARSYQRLRFAVVAFLIAGAGAMTSLLAARYGSADVQDTADSSRRLSLAALDPVSLGHLATSALLCGLTLWRDVSWRVKLLLLPIFFALIWCLMLTGSKGPALALLLCVGLWALRLKRSAIYIVLAIPLLMWLLVSTENPLAARFSESQDDESTLDRIVILSDSLTQIEGSPILGSAFVEINSGFYPHNVFLEAGLALGVPGALVFLYLAVTGMWRAWGTLRTEHDLLGLLFFQATFAAATSGAIFGSALFWVLLVMMPKFGRGRQEQVSSIMPPAPEPAL